MDRCAPPTSWLDCFKSDNKNETIPGRAGIGPEPVCEGNERHAGGRGVSNEQATSSFNFRPAYAATFSLAPCPHSSEPPGEKRGADPPPRAASIANRRAENARLAQVAMETDEKRRPGLFETIIRRSIPLALVLCISTVRGAAPAAPYPASSILPTRIKIPADLTFTDFLRIASLRTDQKLFRCAPRRLRSTLEPVDRVK